jgi:hypothetical protein
MEFTSYERLTIDLLERAKAAGQEFHIRVAELAEQYGMERRYVEEKLVELHNDKLIRLSAFHESRGILRLEEWQSSEQFFAYASDGNYKRILLLGKGAEFLERLALSAAPESPKRGIGFHA